MSMLCRVELSEVHGKLRGLKITHPEMGIIMDWGCRQPAVNVRFVPQEVAFQMMADVERIKTSRLQQKLAAG